MGSIDYGRSEIDSDFVISKIESNGSSAMTSENNDLASNQSVGHFRFRSDSPRHDTSS